jgi:hypothetical protein
MSKPTSDIAVRQTEEQRRAAPVAHINVSTFRENAPAAATAFGGSGVTEIADIEKATAAMRDVRPGGEYRR